MRLADDGFAGAGGWDLAAAALGIEARGIEIMKEARATRDAAGLVTIHDDVWTFVPDGKAVGKIDSPPCQTFSTAGKGSGRKALEDVLRGIRDRYYLDLDHLRFLGEEVGDERTALVLTPLHFAACYEYEWLAWEQVRVVLPVWEACAAVLRELGWHVWTGVLNAADYFVPQDRKRAFLLASRRGPVLPPRALAVGPAQITMAQALGLPRGWSYDSGQNSVVAGGRLERYVRSCDRPSGTVTSKACGQWVLRRGAERRKIGLREATILQSFPAGFPWQGAKGKQFLQVGNAVPPLLAMHALAAPAGVDVQEVAA